MFLNFVILQITLVQLISEKGWHHVIFDPFQKKEKDKF